MLCLSKPQHWTFCFNNGVSGIQSTEKYIYTTKLPVLKYGLHCFIRDTRWLCVSVSGGI